MSSPMTTLFGSIRSVRTIRWLPPTRLNSLAWFSLTWTKWFGKFGRRQKLSSLLGWIFKIEFGPLIGWPSGDGQTMIFAPSARECKKVGHTSSSNADTPLGFGTWSLRNTILRIWTLPLGIWRVLLRIGEQIEPASAPPIEKTWLRSPCLCRGPFGMSGTPGCSVTRAPHHHYYSTSSCARRNFVSPPGRRN